MRLTIDPTEVQALIEDYFEEHLSETDCERLSTILALSSGARSLYWEAASVHGLLEHTLLTTPVMVLSGRALSLAYLKRVWFSDEIHQARKAGSVVYSLWPGISGARLSVESRALVGGHRAPVSRVLTQGAGRAQRLSNTAKSNAGPCPYFLGTVSARRDLKVNSDTADLSRSPSPI